MLNFIHNLPVDNFRKVSHSFFVFWTGCGAFLRGFISWQVLNGTPTYRGAIFDVSEPSVWFLLDLSTVLPSYPQIFAFYPQF